MRTLELFAGTHSFTKGVKRKYGADCETVSVDILPRFAPTHRANILTWDYKIYPPGHFDIIWCSPPCTEYSCAKTRGARDLDTADACVRRCWEIIDYFAPKHWLIENPQTGLLARRMEDIRGGAPFVDADYCAYGTHYRKRTRFWTSAKPTLHMCEGRGKCPGMIGARHIATFGGTVAPLVRDGGIRHTVWERDAIPTRLIDALVDALSDGFE